MSESEPEQQPLSSAKLRRKTAIVVASAIVLAVFAGLAFFFRGGSQSTPEFVREFTSSESALNCLVFSPDGQQLAAGSASGGVTVWNVASGRRSNVETGETEPLLAIGVSADGALLAGGVSRELLARPLSETGAEPLKLPRFPAAITCVAIHPQRPEFAVGLHNGFLYVFRRSQRPAVDSEHSGGVRKAAYSPTGELLVTGGTDGRLVWRDAETLELLHKADVHSTEIGAISFSPDGRWLASGDWNGELKLWDVETRTEIAAGSQADAVSAIGWIDETLITASWDGRVRAWLTERLRPIVEIDTRAAINDMAIHGNTIATVSNHGRVQLWRLSRP